MVGAKNSATLLCGHSLFMFIKPSKYGGSVKPCDPKFKVKFYNEN